MRIGVFAYNFPHYKTQQGLLSLRVNGIRPDVIFAQDHKQLNVPHSYTRVAPIYEFLHDHQKMFDLAEPYEVVIGDHNDQANCIRRFDLDIGIILGARIIHKDIIDAFHFGIINMHPGLIPVNRGLDNLKWAIHDEIPQGVTAHFIDYPSIDSGQIIVWQIVDVLPDDSLVDIHIRLQETEQHLLLEALHHLNHGMIALPVSSEGKYNSAMNDVEEFTALWGFQKYRDDYKRLVRRYEAVLDTDMRSHAY